MRRSWRASVLRGRPEPCLLVWECSTDHCWKQRHTTYTCAAIRRYVHPVSSGPTMRPLSKGRIATTGIRLWDNLSRDDIRHLYGRLHARIHVCVTARRGYTTVAMRGETIRASWTFSHKKTMVKGIPNIGHEGPRGCGCKGAHTYLYTATALGKVRVASPTLGRIYSRYSFYSRLSGPQEQSGYEEVKKISTPPTPGTELGPSDP